MYVCTYTRPRQNVQETVAITKTLSFMQIITNLKKVARGKKVVGFAFSKPDGTGEDEVIDAATWQECLQLLQEEADELDGMLDVSLCVCVYVCGCLRKLCGQYCLFTRAVRYYMHCKVLRTVCIHCKVFVLHLCTVCMYAQICTHMRFCTYVQCLNTQVDIITE